MAASVRQPHSLGLRPAVLSLSVFVTHVQNHLLQANVRLNTEDLTQLKSTFGLSSYFSTARTLFFYSLFQTV